MAVNALAAALLCILLPETRFRPTLETLKNEDAEKNEMSANLNKALDLFYDAETCMKNIFDIAMATA